MKLFKVFKNFFKNQRHVRRQTGYVVLSLAIIGLFGATAGAAPILNRVVGSLNASDTSPVSQSGAACAAEHALWRLEHDPSLWSSMSGSPPSITYQTPACEVLTDADVTISALEDAPTGDDRFRVTLTVSPDVVPQSTDVQFTYTLTVTNDDVVPHNISRVIVDPKWLFKPTAVAGTVSGITTSDPAITGCFLGFCQWQWDFATYVEVPAFGGEVQLVFTAEDNKSFGSHWTGAEVRFDGIGDINAVNSARVRFQDFNTLDIEEFVTPTSVGAGGLVTYDYTIRVTNSDPSPLTLEWICHWAPAQFSYIAGSTEFDGAIFTDPAETHSGWLYQLFTLDSRARYFWNVPPTLINPGDSIDLTFQMQASLEPGTYFSRASAYVAEAPGGIFALLDLSRATTGEIAAIEVHQGFTVVAVHEGHMVEVTGTVTANGIEVLSWKEF